MRGGIKTYRGSPAAARHYVEADRGRADDYYLAEGTGIAERYTASPAAGVQRVESLSGDCYEAWVAGVDPETGVAKGRLRHDDQAVRFVEVTVNGPKTWSLAAELHPDISAAYDAAQDRAAEQIIGWLGQHATTRVGPRGQQVQVPVQEIEAAVVRHHTSRAGDPHRHLHLQINARVHAAGGWRGLHTVGVRDSLGAINGIGHAAVATDPEFRAALAAHGFTLDETGEITQLAKFVAPFSARAAQIGRNIERYETQWRAANPDREPGRGLRRSWDARAWADARPDKIVPADGAELTHRWITELHELGYREQRRPVLVDAAMVGSLDRERVVELVLARLGARRSGWNAADIRGEVEQLLAANIVTVATVRGELAEDLTARAVAESMPLLHRSGVPEHVRALTSAQVLEVETDLTTRLTARAAAPRTTPAIGSGHVPGKVTARLDTAQRDVVHALSGDAQLMVVEGAAGAGKTTTLAATHAALEQSGHSLRVVTPTLKAARVAQTQVGTGASSVAWLAWQHGFRWNEHGLWTRLSVGQTDPGTGIAHAGPAPSAALRAGDLLLVDEAGMLDQDAARALLTIADEHDVRVAFVGDRHQLPAVGRGGVLDLAARITTPDALLTLDSVHRFTHTLTNDAGVLETVTDAEYAQLSLAMRTGANPENVFDALLERGQIQVHATDAGRVAAVADNTVDALIAGVEAVVIADTNDQVTALNHSVREHLVDAGRVDDTTTANSASGQVGVGDRVVTRRNDTTLEVANRDTWTVTGVHRDGSISVTGERGERVLPAGYVGEFVQLGYVSTVHGVQGDTATTAHLVVGDHTSAASAYVGMTRGRESNMAHLVADSIHDAREQWVAAFGRDRADLGPTHAAELAAREAANYTPLRPIEDVLVELRQAWTVEADALERVADLKTRADTLRQVVAIRQAADPPLRAAGTALDQARDAADAAAARAERLTASVARDADRIRDSLLTDWERQRPAAHQAAHTVAAGTGRLGQRRGAVHAAHDHLAQWAATWQPYLTDLPTDPAQLAHRAASWDNHTAIWTAFDQHAQHRAADLHPEHAAVLAAAEDARAAAQQARVDYRDAAHGHDRQLRPYGPPAHAVDPAARLADTEHALSEAVARRDGARDTLHGLEHDPTLTTQPVDLLTREREQWQHDRATQLREHAQQAEAARLAADPRRRQGLTTPGLGWTPPSSSPSSGPSIGL